MRKLKKRLDEPENKPKGSIPAPQLLKPPSVDELLGKIDEALYEGEMEDCGCWGRA